MFVRLTLALVLTTLLGAPILAQSDSAKTQAVFTADQLAERCAAAFTRYERFESSGRLLENGATGQRVWVEIVDGLRRELSAAITGYLKAVDSGWEPSEPELAQARGKIEAVHARMKGVGVWTCFRWEDAPLPAAARDGLDKIRTTAWEGALLVERGQLDDAAASFQFARKLIAEHGAAIDAALDTGQDVEDTRTHAAHARTLAEVERLEASVAGELGNVQQSRARLAEDVAKLAAASRQHAPFLLEIQNRRAPSGSEDAIIEAIDKLRKRLDEFDQSGGEDARRSLAEFGGRYGTTRDEIEGAVIRIMGNESLPPSESPTMLYDSLDRGLRRIVELRTEMTEQLLEIAADNAATEATDPVRQQEAFDRARGCIELALHIDPGNADAVKLRESLGAGAAAAAEKTESLLDQGTWEDHSSTFQGPGKTDDLAESAREWLAGDAGWTKDKDVLAVRINGDWVVAEKDREGETVSWGLPVEAAFVRHADRDAARDAAIVFRLTMVTRSVEQAPPFKMARVGSTRQMRASNISAGRGGGSGDDDGGGGPNVLFRLLLVLALLTSGLLLVGPAVPTLGSLLGRLTPLRPVIGVSTLGIGVLLFVLSLLSPLSDILPQAAAIVAGLFLGLELLLRKSSGAAALEKAQNLLERQKERIGKIGAYQLPLGVACVTLALLHLAAAGAPLV